MYYFVVQTPFLFLITIHYIVAKILTLSPTDLVRPVQFLYVCICYHWHFIDANKYAFSNLPFKIGKIERVQNTFDKYFRGLSVVDSAAFRCAVSPIVQ